VFPETDTLCSSVGKKVAPAYLRRQKGQGVSSFRLNRLRSRHAQALYRFPQKGCILPAICATSCGGPCQFVVIASPHTPRCPFNPPRHVNH
jgi:hypothetical protein